MLGIGKTTCRSVEPDLVAWIDGALPDRRARRVAVHVEGCPTCGAAAGSLRASARAQSRALRRHLADRPPDVDRMWRHTRASLADVPPQPRWNLAWVVRPAVAFAVSLAFVLGLGVTAVGGPETVLISLGVEEPPLPLEKKPDLFKEYSIIEELDVLERFDTADVDRMLDPVTPGRNQG
jgi:anti-sigma factor RsiW